jgi:Xaa-Pro aminopeptidase
MRFYYRYVLIPREGKVLLFGGLGDTLAADATLEVRAGRSWDYFTAGRHVDEAARQWAAELALVIRELGLARERIGIDRLDYLGFEALRAREIRLADARVPIERARAVKTADELTLLRQACAVADVAICAVRDAICPGVTENELWGILTGTNIRLGGEHTDGRLLAAGEHTNPWYQAASDRMVRDGELVAFDTDMAGPMGYFADVSRTYLHAGRGASGVTGGGEEDQKTCIGAPRPPEAAGSCAKSGVPEKVTRSAALEPKSPVTLPTKVPDRAGMRPPLLTPNLTCYPARPSPTVPRL